DPGGPPRAQPARAVVRHPLQQQVDEPHDGRRRAVRELPRHLLPALAGRRRAFLVAVMLARPGVARFLARRRAQAVPTVLLIIVVNFLVLHLTPGDIVDVLAGEAGAATPEYVATLRERSALDRPLPMIPQRHMWGVVSLDRGFSFRHNMTVAHLMLD